MGDRFKLDYISYDSILDQIDNINQGDLVYVISDVLELAKIARNNGEKFNASNFLSTLMHKVGEEGTVVVPTFNWDFCEGKTFDYNKTPGKTGALGNAALKDERFKRTKHPIYSFAVCGREQQKICSIDTEDSFGENTVFGYLYRNNAKALVIGLNALEGLTMVHYVEQVIGVPYRYFKTFEGKYIDEQGTERKKRASMYVRDLNIDPEEDMEHLSQILEDLNVSRTKIINDIPFRVVLHKQTCEIVKIDIELNGSKNLYKFGDHA